MSNFTDKELKATLWVGASLALLGLAGVLVGQIKLAPRSYWVEYIAAARGGGWLAALFGTVIAAMAAARRYTSFFDLRRGLGADKFALSLVAIVGVVIVAAVMALRLVPETPVARLPPDPGIRAKVQQQERHWRRLAVATIVLSGAAIGAFPVGRFFRS